MVRSWDLLAAEITARTGKDPGEHYRELTSKFGSPCYTASMPLRLPNRKHACKKLSPDAVRSRTWPVSPSRPS